MDMTIHSQILLLVFGIAVIMGAVVNKTNFCTMGAVSDWVNMGDTRPPARLAAGDGGGAAGVLALEATGVVTLGTATFPPYRTPTSPGCATCSAACCSASA